METTAVTSPTGWWIACLLEFNEHSGRAKYWHNYRLVRADHWREAFRKAVSMGQSEEVSGRRAFSGRTQFAGVTHLLPVYDDFEDGAELLYQELESPESIDALPLRIWSEEEMEEEYARKG